MEQDSAARPFIAESDNSDSESQASSVTVFGDSDDPVRKLYNYLQDHSRAGAILDKASWKYKDMTGEDTTTHPYVAKPTTSYPTSNMRAILDEASRQYKDMTGEDITTHPYTAKLEKWDSVDTVLEVFQGQVQAFNEFRKGDKKLMKWLHHVVHTLIAVCGPLGDAVGVVGLKHLVLPHHCALTLVSQSFPPAQGIFVCINVLLTVGLFPNTIACGHVTLSSTIPGRGGCYRKLRRACQSFRAHPVFPTTSRDLYQNRKNSTNNRIDWSIREDNS